MLIIILKEFLALFEFFTQFGLENQTAPTLHQFEMNNLTCFFKEMYRLLKDLGKKFQNLQVIFDEKEKQIYQLGKAQAILRENMLVMNEENRRIQSNLKEKEEMVENLVAQLCYSNSTVHEEIQTHEIGLDLEEKLESIAKEEYDDEIHIITETRSSPGVHNSTNHIQQLKENNTWNQPTFFTFSSHSQDSFTTNKNKSMPMHSENIHNFTTLEKSESDLGGGYSKPRLPLICKIEKKREELQNNKLLKSSVKNVLTSFEKKAESEERRNKHILEKSSVCYSEEDVADKEKALHDLSLSQTQRKLKELRNLNLLNEKNSSSQKYTHYEQDSSDYDQQNDNDAFQKTNSNDEFYFLDIMKMLNNFYTSKIMCLVFTLNNIKQSNSKIKTHQNLAPPEDLQIFNPEIPYNEDLYALISMNHEALIEINDFLLQYLRKESFPESTLHDSTSPKDKKVNICINK
jgi:hypothetical protein